MSTYGPGKVEFEAKTTSILPDDFVLKTLLNLAQQDKSNLIWYNGQGEPKIGYKFLHCKDGFGFFYFENGSESTSLKAEVELVKFTGCKMRKNSLNNNK